MSLFPIFLKLAARPCVVVGAGNIAESKIESLLAAEASVTVIAPEALPRLMGDPDPKKASAVMKAMMKMKRIIIKDLETAHQNA